MPYIKKKEEPWQKMTRLLRGYGYTGESLGKVLLCSGPTGRDRIRNPGHLTLSDIDRLNRFGHIPMEELREAMVR